MSARRSPCGDRQTSWNAVTARPCDSAPPRSRRQRTETKRFYTASAAALFLTILVNPVAGFLGYPGSHAIEYFIIVHRSVGPKYASADADGRAPVGYAVRRLGRAGFFAAYIAVVFGALSLLDRYGSPTSYTVVILTLGAMHVFYDGFIWKRPAADRGGMLSVDRPSRRP